MESFQKYILFSAIIILIISLVFIGIALSKSYKQEWPPIIPECPDYWKIDASGICVNSRNLGVCPPQTGQPHLTMDFNSPAFTGSNELCSKYAWAQKCKVSWDGITYGVNNPCQTSS